MIEVVRLRQRIARRRQQRGAAVFVIVVTTIAIAALGIIAVSTTAQLNRAVGNSRHQLQTHFVTDMAVASVISDMSGNAGREYLGMVLAKQSTDCEAYASMSSKECFVVGYEHIRDSFAENKAPVQLIEPPTAIKPGSLGPTDLAADFKVELNDMVRAERPVAGFDIGGDRLWTYYSITVTASAQVRPRDASDGKVDAISAGAAGRERARAHLVLGPFEKGSILPPL